MARVKKYSSEQQHTTRHVRKKKSTATAGDIILFVLIVVAAVALVISYISIVIDPAVFPIPSFFGLYYIPIALINLILLLFAIIRLNKSLFIRRVMRNLCAIHLKEYIHLRLRHHLTGWIGKRCQQLP